MLVPKINNSTPVIANKFGDAIEIVSILSLEFKESLFLYVTCNGNYGKQDREYRQLSPIHFMYPRCRKIEQRATGKGHQSSKRKSAQAIFQSTNINP